LGVVFALGLIALIIALIIFASAKNGKNRKDAVKILIAAGIYVFVALIAYIF
jgi:multisubunit Na+/H+ antiporter MnhB subunit